MADYKPLSFDLSPADFLNNIQFDDGSQDSENSSRVGQKRKSESALDVEDKEELTKRVRVLTADETEKVSVWPASVNTHTGSIFAATNRGGGDGVLGYDQGGGGSVVDTAAANMLNKPENLMIHSTLDLSPVPHLTSKTELSASSVSSTAGSIPPKTLPAALPASAVAANTRTVLSNSEADVHSLLNSLTGGGIEGRGDLSVARELSGNEDATSSYIFNSLNDKEFQKTYELLVISNFIKLYPEMISDLDISRTALSQYDDEKRQKKFNLCKLYVLIQIESESMRSLTSVFGLILRVVIYVMFPCGVSKTLESALSRVLESTEKKTSALFYFHAVSSLKKRNYEAPNIYYGYITELLRMVAALATEYMITVVKT